MTSNDLEFAIGLSTVNSTTDLLVEVAVEKRKRIRKL